MKTSLWYILIIPFFYLMVVLNGCNDIKNINIQNDSFFSQVITLDSICTLNFNSNAPWPSFGDNFTERAAPHFKVYRMCTSESRYFLNRSDLFEILNYSHLHDSLFRKFYWQFTLIGIQDVHIKNKKCYYMRWYQNETEYINKDSFTINERTDSVETNISEEY